MCFLFLVTGHAKHMPRIILPSVACLALLYFTAARLTPSLEEGRLPAVRDCLMQFPSHSVLNVNHTICLSVCLSSHLNSRTSLNLMRALPCHWNPLLSGIFKSPTLCYNKVADAQISEVGETPPSLPKSSNCSNAYYHVT